MPVLFPLLFPFPKTTVPLPVPDSLTPILVVPVAALPSPLIPTFKVPVSPPIETTSLFPSILSVSHVNSETLIEPPPESFATLTLLPFILISPVPLVDLINTPVLAPSLLPTIKVPVLLVLLVILSVPLLPFPITTSPLLLNTSVSQFKLVTLKSVSFIFCVISSLLYTVPASALLFTKSSIVVLLYDDVLSYTSLTLALSSNKSSTSLLV